MKAFRLVWAAVLVGLLVLPAAADMTATLGSAHSTVAGYGGGYFDVVRGPSLAEWAANGVTSDFRTFCVERITFNPGTPYKATIDDLVLNGAVPPLALDPLTKVLYAHYRADAGAPMAQSVIVGDDANSAMQGLIWDLEGVISGTAGQVGAGFSNAYATLNANEKNLYTSFYNYALANPIASAANVRVLNLWMYENGNLVDIQSQLVMVPVPGVALLSLIGLGLVGWIKRRIA